MPDLSFLITIGHLPQSVQMALAGLFLLALVMRRASGAMTTAGLAGVWALMLPLAQLAVAHQVAVALSAVMVSSIAVVRQAIGMPVSQ